MDGVKIPILIASVSPFLCALPPFFPIHRTTTVSSPPPPVMMTKKAGTRKYATTSTATATAAAADSTAAGGLKRVHGDWQRSSVNERQLETLRRDGYLSSLDKMKTRAPGGEVL